MIRALFRKQLQELFAAFVRSGRTGRRRTRGQRVGYAALFLALLLVLMVCFGAMALPLSAALVPQGGDWLYFASMELTALLVSVLAGAFTSYTSLFQSRDNEMLLSLPIPPGVIFAVRVSTVYLTSLIYLLLVWAPTVRCYLGFAPAPAGALLSAVPMALLLAGAASLLSVLLGWAVALGNARARHKSLVTVVCSLLFLALYYAGFLKVQSLLDELAADAAQLGTALQQGSGPLYVLGRAAMGDLPALAGLAVGVLLGTAGVFRLLEKPYLRRMTAQHGTPKAVYHAVRTKAVSLRRALLRRELRHLGSSAAYLLNASLGTMLLPALGAAALWKTPALRAFVHGTLPGTAACLVCCAICGGSAVNLLTAPSVSLEGRSLWLIRSLPVTAWQALRAKLDLHLLLTAVPALAAGVCMLAALQAPLAGAVLALAAVVLFNCFTAELGLLFGLLLPNLQWTNEAAVIKMSMSTLLSLLCSGLAVLALSLANLYGAAAAPPEAVLAVCSAVLAGADLLLLRWLKTSGAARFEALS